MICGIRGGKTYAGAREASKQAWECRQDGVYGIIAPTFHMLKRTTWREFRLAAAPLIKQDNSSDMIITLKNGREVHGFSADKPDRIRNATLGGFWLDEGRECKEGIWEILLGRVLSTEGKGILTTPPNSFDWIHDVFVESGDADYGMIRFSTYENSYLKKESIDALARKYDPKFAEQELGGKFVVFEGAVYYTFDRRYNAGDFAFKVCNYNPTSRIELMCDFNVDPMCWVIGQTGIHVKSGLPEIRVIDEIRIPNGNTESACKEFITRYPGHDAGITLYGDATGKSRTANSNVTNWQIIEDLLSPYGIINEVPASNPAERDRVNSSNGLICNSKGERHVQIHPSCKYTIRDLEQVIYKKGTTQIDKKKDAKMTHLSDGLGYRIDRDFSINKGIITGIPVKGA